jgi:uncharacterized protein (DUF1810 family)
MLRFRLRQLIESELAKQFGSLSLGEAFSCVYVEVFGQRYNSCSINLFLALSQFGRVRELLKNANM